MVEIPAEQGNEMLITRRLNLKHGKSLEFKRIYPWRRATFDDPGLARITHVEGEISYKNYTIYVGGREDYAAMAYIVVDEHGTVLNYVYEDYCCLQLGDALTEVLLFKDNIIAIANYGDIESTILIKFE